MVSGIPLSLAFALEPGCSVFHVSHGQNSFYKAQ